MEKNKHLHRSIYAPPEAKLTTVGLPLHLLDNFSLNGNGQDWEFSDAWWELEDERNLGTNDWGGFGGLGNDTD